MTSPRPVRLLLPLLALLLCVPAVAAAPASADHTGESPGPVNAGTTYGWWAQDGVRWMEHWEEAVLEDRWRVRGRGVVQPQHGMLTLDTTRHGSLGATLLRKPRTTGRWEIRLRAHRFETAHRDYRVQTALVPRAAAQQRCGSSDVALESFELGGPTVDLYARNGTESFEDVLAVDHGDQAWHTYAVEVTTERISWFVDAHVVRTERRPEALSGAPLTVKLAMVGVRGERMNKSRMQLDWLRHFNLNGPNRQPVDAPRMTQVTTSNSC